MNKLDIKSFNNLKEDLQKEGTDIEVIISLGTCGIAAGGEEVYNYFKEEIKRRGLENIKLKKTGCLGLCSLEPNVEIKVKGMPSILYGEITKEVVEKLFNYHICNKKILSEYVIAFPAADLYNIKKEEG